MQREVMYLCDRRACEVCRPDCEYTTKIEHADSFVRTEDGKYVEETALDFYRYFAAFLLVGFLTGLVISFIF